MTGPGDAPRGADAVTLLEMAPRDGLQNERQVLATDDKVALVERAVAGGATRIEVTSFVNPAKVPQLADAAEVMAALPRHEGVSYAGLVMNRRGLERALAAGVDEVDVVVVATDTFCLRNQGTTTAEAGDLAAAIVADARAAGALTTITVAAAFGCPFEGTVSPARLGDVLARVVDAGPDEIALADTIGVAVPTDITERVGLARVAAGRDVPLRLHLHDTRNTGAANAVAGWLAGVETFDASLGGAGGCPFAPDATGNVATEDLAYLFDRMGVRTGFDLVAGVETAIWLEERLQRGLPGAIMRAGGFPTGR